MTITEMASRAGKQIAFSMWGWVERRHAPIDIAGDGTGPAICPLCKVEWPCSESLRAFREREGLRAELGPTEVDFR